MGTKRSTHVSSGADARWPPMFSRTAPVPEWNIRSWHRLRANWLNTGSATLRFQFPYMQKSLKRPDPAPIAQAAVRAAVIEAARRLPDVPLFAGGKSFGGRMTSQAQAEEPLPGSSA